jgi:hypothetical protein
MLMAYACGSGHVRAMITAHPILREETGPLVVRFRTRCFAPVLMCLCRRSS